MDVTPSSPRAFSCPTPRVASDQSIRLRLQFTTPGVCAAVWTHIADTHAYRVRICAGQAEVDIDQGPRSRTVATSAIDPPAQTQKWHQVDIHIPDNGLTIIFDGETLINRTRLPRLSRGSISLGALPAQHATDQVDGHITYADIVIDSVP
jgi:hypothetical protein